MCEKNILQHEKILFCSCCCKYAHRNCSGLSKAQYEYARSDTSWYCKKCIEEIFPFNHIDDECIFLRAISEISVSSDIIVRYHSECKIFNPFEINEDDSNILEYHGDLDPDKCFFNQHSHSLLEACNYQTEQTFNNYVSQKGISNNNFSVFHLNIRSVPANLSSLLSDMENLDHRFSVIGLTETWLNPSNIDAYGIDGYNHIGITRSNQNGGGVSLFMSNEISYSELTEFTKVQEYIECLFLKINFKDIIYIIGIVYRPPNSDIEQFTETLNDILSQISHLPCYIMGDYNLDLLKHECHNPTEHFLNTMYSNSLIPLIYKPTRETDSTATLIDNIFTNHYDVNDKLYQGIFLIDISDHYGIFHIMDKQCTTNDSSQLLRVINESRIEKYKDCISNTDWTALNVYENCETYYKHFIDKFKNIYDHVFPVIRVKKRYRNRLPWLTPGLKESIKHKNKLSRKHPTAYNKMMYKDFRNKTTALLRITEKQYYQEQIIENKNNLRKTWVIIKQVMNKNKNSKICDKFTSGKNTITDPKTIANAFNNYFANVGATLASKIPDQGVDFSVYMPPANEYSLFLTPASENGVKCVIANLNDGSPGKHGVTAKSLKTVSDAMATPITHLANMSFIQGVFPQDLKNALVCPIYKAKDPMVFSNYRPISLLSIFSKILERLMYHRLLKFLNKHKILNKFQFGFRNMHSTFMALITLLDNLRNALDSDNCAVGIFLDFQKAFDTVNHKILLGKLNCYGIRGIALDWFSSYLRNRSQTVVYNEQESEMKETLCGVPQGSILGPLLFLLYINDLPSVSKLFMPILFADDTNLFCNGPNLNELIEKINEELKLIYKWVNVNKLSLNIEKTNFMLFTPKNFSCLKETVVIDNHPIKEVCHIKFLGVIIDNKLKWKDHIDYISKKIAKGIGVIIKARKVFDKTTLLSIYNSLILPYIGYCIHIWGNAYQTHLQKLHVLQNKIVRIIAGVPRRTSSDHLYCELNILKLKKLYLYAVGLCMYKYENDMLPELFKDMFIKVTDVHEHDTRNATTDQLYIPIYGTVRGQKSFKYAGVRTWNYILQNVNTRCPICTFKSSLRKLCMVCPPNDIEFLY